MLRAITLIGFLLLTACSSFTPRAIDPPELPKSYRNAQQAETTVLAERWWQNFSDPQLDRLQQQMLNSNLDLQQALYRLDQLEALQRISGSSLLPTLTLSGSASREKSAASNFKATNSRLSLAANYEIDLWNRLRNQEQAAELRQQAGQADVQTLLLSLSVQLADQYFLSIEQRAQLQSTRQQLVLYRQLQQTIIERYRSGLANASETYQVEQKIAQAEAQLPTFQRTLNRSENAISLLLGQLPQQQSSNKDELPELTTVINAGLPASLMTRRPDVNAALLQLKAADQELAAAIADRLPALNLTATLGHSATQLATGDVNGSLWSLVLGLTQPFFDGGRRKAESDRQHALRDEQLVAYRKTILAAVLEVETSLSNDQNSALRNRWLQQQVKASEANLLLARDNYRSGLTNSQDLLNAELNHLNVTNQLLTAHRQWLSDRISLARALGGDWMSTEIDQQRQRLNDQRDKL